MANVLQNPGRRDALRWATGLTAGVALTQISGCGDGFGTSDTLPEPENLSASNGLLELKLTATYSPRQVRAASIPQTIWPAMHTLFRLACAATTAPLLGRRCT